MSGKQGRLPTAPGYSGYAPSPDGLGHSASIPSAIHVLFSEDGQHIRKWAREPFEGARPYANYEAEADGWERGMRDAANICSSLAETTYDDSDAFEAATGCEACIVSDLRNHQANRHKPPFVELQFPIINQGDEA